MRYLNKFLTLIAVLVFFSCSDDDDAPPPVEPIAVDLIFPNNNQICQEGEIVGSDMITIPFEWSEDLNATSYKLIVTKQSSGETIETVTTDTLTSLGLSLGTQYNWAVSSIIDGKEATSEVWNFYTQGKVITTHVPFPAEITIKDNNDGSIDLSWNAVDLDGDITHYDIYLLDKNPPALYKENETGTSIKAIPLISGKLYYVEVDVIDSAGNKAKSKTSFTVK
ncbi:fibronectin type III domain-containing protein [Aquimarina sp. AU58]|uniref:fibronectin type III domain-containing protein n=1 Tax=Aquimarina sp. AU58 TaxID=1874112 RepID=UPI000D6DEC63|nr:fibronectin type III domain-containing protein [Aquimarina sp. AU58]